MEFTSRTTDDDDRCSSIGNVRQELEQSLEEIDIAESRCD